VRRFAAFVRPVLAKVQALLTEAVLGAAAAYAMFRALDNYT
jgi:hypothetical protein